MIKFKKGDSQYIFEVKIIDDEGWEPDEDFFIQLYQPGTNTKLEGADCCTRVTIIDDDEPGQLSFEYPMGVQVTPEEGEVKIKIKRDRGSDGVVTVDYETIELGNTAGGYVAVAGRDFERASGEIKFEH